MSGRTFVSRGTTFRGFVARKVRWCSSCRASIGVGASAWMPINGNGGWSKDARLCLRCGGNLEMRAGAP